jgi:XTP/dITP diphosphohydrolase
MSADHEQRLLLATTNQGKIRDLRRCLAGTGWTLFTPADLGLALEVEETGSTYEDNARLKARAHHEAAGLTTIGEDSGLEVDELGGAPGLFSARWRGLPDGPIKNAEMLRELEDVPSSRRRCRYRCTIVAISPDGEEQVFAGVCAGRIAYEQRGSGGFGFDPIVEIPRLARTLAELSDEDRIAVNHRGRAARKLARWLAARQQSRDARESHRAPSKPLL